MGEASIVGSKWRLVEVGRVVLLQGDSAYAGRLATIVEIIDHKRVCGYFIQVSRNLELIGI
jgi:large subunit ribosomal protein L14e